MSIPPRRRVARRRRAFAEALEPRRLLSAGRLDPTFGNAGAATAELFNNASAGAGAIQSDGKIVVAGSSASGNTGYLDLARFNPDGSLDRTFGTNGRTTARLNGGFVSAMAIGSDGKIVVTGQVNPLGMTSTNVARFLPNGKIDRHFARNGIATFSLGGGDFPTAIVVRHDGKIVVAGSAMDGKIGDNFYNDGIVLARLTVGGALDPTFGKSGKVVTGFRPGTTSGASSLSLLPNGQLLVAGYQTNYDSGLPVSAAVLARYHRNGSLDASFGNKGIVVDPAMTGFDSINVLSDGKILAGGEDSAGHMAASRFTSSGSIDTRFGVNGIASIPQPSSSTFALLVQKGGSIVLVAAGPRSFPTLVARLSAAGQLDTSFGNAGSGITTLDQVNFIKGLLQRDHKIVLIGNPFPPPAVFSLGRLTANGRIDNTFGGTGLVEDPDGISGGINAMALQPDKKIIVAGIQNAPTQANPYYAVVARYNANGSLDTTFGDSGRAVLNVGGNAAFTSLVLESDGDIAIAGYGRAANGSGPSEFLLARFLPNGTLDTSFGQNGRVVLSLGDKIGQQFNGLAVQPNGDFIAVGRVGGLPGFSDDAGNKMAVARFLPNGTLDPYFGNGGWVLLDPLHPFSNGAIATNVAILRDGRIIVGGDVGPDFGVVRLNPDGSLDTSFGSAGVATAVSSDGFASDADQAYAMAIDAAGRIILGGSIDNGEMVLARFNANGSADRTFGTAGVLNIGSYFSSGLTGINAIGIQGDKIIFGGGSAGVIGRASSHGLDPTFGNKGLTSLDKIFDVTALLVQPDGKILAAAGSDLFRLLGK